MTAMERARRALRRGLRRRGAEFRLSLRMTAAGFLAFALAQLLGLTVGFWAVLTAVIVIQASVGGSLKAAFDQLVGSLSGAIYGTAVAALVPRDEPVALALGVIVAIAPAAVLAAMIPSFRVAPVTAAIVLLGTGSANAGLVASAIERVLEISLGTVVGLGVSILVVPARAHRVLAGTANRTLRLLAQLLAALFARLTGTGDASRIPRLINATRLAGARIETVGAEAVRERASRLSDGPDPEPLMHTLARIRTDLIVISRAATEPLPEAAREWLQQSLWALQDAILLFMHEAGDALMHRGPPPGVAALDDAFDAYAEAMATMRRERLTHDMPGEAVGRIFALGFVLEQLRRNLADLASRTREFAAPEGTIRRGAAKSAV